MRRHPVLLAALFVFLSVTFSYSQTISKPLPVPLSTKVDRFIQTIQAATSLSQVQTAFTQAAFTKTETDQLQIKIEGAPAVKQKLVQLQQMAIAAVQPELDQFKLAAQAKVRTLQQAYATTASVQQLSFTESMIMACAGAPLAIDGVDGMPLRPGSSFRINGKGLERNPGSVDVIIRGGIYPARIDGWNTCGVYARLGSEISGLLASNEAQIKLTTQSGKVTTKFVSFQPTIAVSSVFDSGACNGQYWGCSKDWDLNNYSLKNDCFVASREFYPQVNDGHSEMTFASPANVPNGSARTGVHAGAKALGWADWWLFTYIGCPAGLTYK